MYPYSKINIGDVFKNYNNAFTLEYLVLDKTDKMILVIPMSNNVATAQEFWTKSTNKLFGIKLMDGNNPF